MNLFALILLFLSVNCAVIPENKPQLSSDFALPDIQKICDHEVNVDQCIRQAVSDVISQLYSQLPPIRLSLVDPVAADAIRQASKSSGPTKIYSNSNVTEVNIYFPKIVVEGTYQADMRYQGFNKVTSGPFNVAMSRPEPNQKPVVNSVLGDGLTSTGDFLVNLGPSILQNLPGVNVAQTQEELISGSMGQQAELPQISNYDFIGNKPKSTAVVANPKDQINQQFDSSGVENIPPKRFSSGINLGSTEPNIQSMTQSKPEILQNPIVPPTFIRPSSTQAMTKRPAIKNKPGTNPIYSPALGIPNNPKRWFEADSDQTNQENRPNLETQPKPNIPPILIRPSSTEESSKRPVTENKPGNQMTLDMQPETLEIPIMNQNMMRPTSSFVETKPSIPQILIPTLDMNSVSLMENPPNVENLPRPFIESNFDTQKIPGSKQSSDDTQPNLSSDTPLSSQGLGEDSPQPAFMDDSQISLEQDTPEQPIIQSKPTSDAVVDSATQINEQPDEDTPFTSDSGPSIFMTISEDTPISAQTSDSTKPFDEMTISSLDFALPSFVKPCDEDDPDFDRCLREAIWAIIPSLYSEYQPFQIRRLNPLNTERTHIDYDSGYFQVAADFEDLVTRGLNEAMYRDIRMKISNGVVRADVNLFLPKINLEARYNAEFEYNGLKIPASGPFNVTMTDVDMTQKWTGHFITKNQHKYLNVDSIEMIPAVGSVNFIRENYLSGDPKSKMTDKLFMLLYSCCSFTEDIALTYLNQNWADMYKELVQSTRSSWEPIMLVAVNEFLGRLPFDVLTIPKPTLSTISRPFIYQNSISPEEITELVQPVMPSMSSETNVVPMEILSSVDEPGIPDAAQTSSGFPTESEVGDTKLPISLSDNVLETSEAPIKPMIANEPESSTQPIVMQVPTVGEVNMESKPKEEVPTGAPSTYPGDNVISMEEFMLPNYVKPCYEDDFDYDQCVRVAIYQIFPQLYEKLHPLQKPLLDPLVIENAHIDYDDPRDVQVSLDFVKMDVYGMNEAELRDIGIRIYTDRARAEVNLFYPRIILKGTYNVRIQYKGLTFTASGPVNITMTDIEMAQVWKGNFINKNGHRYLKLDSIEMNPEIGSASFELSEVLDPSRKEIAINFLNENWGMLYKALLSGTKSFWEPVMINYFNEFLENLPFDVLTKPKKTDMSTQVPFLVGSTTISAINMQDSEKGEKDDDFVLPGEKEEDIVLPGENDDDFVLPGEKEEDIVLPGENDDDFMLPGEKEEDIVLPGENDDDFMLPGEKNEDTVLPHEKEEDIELPGEKEENIVTPGETQSIISSTQETIMPSKSSGQVISTIITEETLEDTKPLQDSNSNLAVDTRIPDGNSELILESKPKEEVPTGAPSTYPGDNVVSMEEFMLPNYVKPCYEDDFDYDQCVRVAIYQIFPQLYEKFHPLQKPLLDPLLIENAHIDYDDPRDVQVSLDFVKMDVYGMNEAELRDIGIRIYTDRARAEVNLFYPRIILKGTYNVRIQYKGLTFPASGPVNITMTDIEMAQVWKGNFINKNGHRYLKLDSIEMNPEIGSASFELSEVLDPSRKEIAINFLNENWGMLYKTFLSGTKSFWEPVMINYFNEFLENLPFDVLTKPKKTDMSTQVPFLVGSTTISAINMQDSEKGEKDEDIVLPGEKEEDIVLPGETDKDIVLPGEMEENIVTPGETQSIISSTQETIMPSKSSGQVISTIITEETLEDTKPLQDSNSNLAVDTRIPDGNSELILIGEQKLCNENDPSFDQCIQESVSTLIPGLFVAIKPFDSPGIDPLIIPNAKVDYNNDILQSFISLENFATHGMSIADYRDIQFKIDGDNVRVDFKVFFPQLNLDGVYNAKIQIKFVELNPSGPLHVTMYDVEMTQHWKGHFVMKNGHRYVEVDEIEMSPEIGRVDFHLDQGINEIASIFSQSWGGIYKLLVPATRAFWEPPMKNALNQFLSCLPFDLLTTSEARKATMNSFEPPISTGESSLPPTIVDTITPLQEPSTSSEPPMPPPQPASTENAPIEEAPPPAPPTEKPMPNVGMILRQTVKSTGQLFKNVFEGFKTQFKF